VDTTAVEQVEIARLDLNLLLFNPVLCGVFIIGTVGEVGMHLRTPNAPMYNSLGTVSIMGGVLYTNESRKLVCKTGDLIVE
jgi:hypothetical protein